MSTSTIPESEHPSYYARFVIEPIDFCLVNAIPFLEGCIIKYVCRWRHKGTPMDDLLKAKSIINKLIKHLEKSGY